MGLPIAGLAVAAVVIAVLGGDPGRAVPALLTGAAGSPAAVTESLHRATPLLFTGLAVAVAFRAGIWNIGAEGQLLMGMLAATAAALSLPELPAPLGTAICLAAGGAAGAAWAGIAAWLRTHREVPEIISTIMLNFLAVYLIEYLVRGPLRDTGSINDWSPPLPEHVRLGPAFGPAAPESAGVTWAWPGGFSLALGLDMRRLHSGVLLAAATAGAAWLWLARTRQGLGLLAAGLSPEAARASGLDTARLAWTAMLVSGLLAGLAGSVEQLAVISRLHRFAPGEPGYGFSGIPVALLGNLSPPGVALSALFFGALAAGCDRMQRAAGIPFQVAYVVQAALVLLLAARARPRTGE